MIQASKFGQVEEAAEAIELTEEERAMEGKLRVMWSQFYFDWIFNSPDFYSICDKKKLTLMLMASQNNSHNNIVIIEYHSLKKNSTTF